MSFLGEKTFFNSKCYGEVLEVVHTYPMERHCHFEGIGVSKPKFLKGSMEVFKLEFLRGGGLKLKKPFVDRLWIISGSQGHRMEYRGML